MPALQVARTVENRGYIALAEEAALDDGIDGLENAGRTELERTGDVEAPDGDSLRRGVVYHGTGGVDRKGVGVGIEMRGDIGIHHAPLICLQREDIGIGDAGRIDNDALVDIVIEHAALLQELGERQCGQALIGSMLVPEHGVQLGEARQQRSVERILRADGLGNAPCLRTADEHDAAVCGEEHGGIELRDAAGVGADIAGDGLTGGIGAGGRYLQRPDSLGSEGIEGKLSELAFGKSLGCGTDALDFARANSIDAEKGEVEGVVDLGGVDLVGQRDGEASASLGGTGGREGGEVFTAHKLVIEKGVGTVKEIVRTEVYGIAQRIIVADDKLIGVDVRIEDVAAP